MGIIEQGQKVRVFHPDHWLEPFRAIVMHLEDDEHVLVCALDPVVGWDGKDLFEGEHLVVETTHVTNDSL